MSAQAPLRLPPTAVTESAAHLSRAGRYHFTRRNLYYELVRRSVCPAPEGQPRAALDTFRQALTEHERAEGELPGLIRSGRVMLRRSTRTSVAEAPPDLFEYDVRRVLVFDRADTFLLFAMNGFHRRIEMGLVLHPGFPAWVWRSLERQLERGVSASFHTVHDCNTRGYALRRRLERALAKYPRAKITTLGLHFGQAFQLGVPVRTVGSRVSWEYEPGQETGTDLLLASGSYAHLEELPPLELLRWAYARVAKGHEEAGFG